MERVPKKRNMDPLGTNAHEERCVKARPDVSLSYLREGNVGSHKIQADEAPSSKRMNNRQRKAASMKGHSKRKKGGFLSSSKILEHAFCDEEGEEDEEEDDEEEEEEESEDDVDGERPNPIKKTRISDGRFESCRRTAIAYFFEYIYGAPPETEWPAVISGVIVRLGMSSGSRNVVQNVFLVVVEADKDGHQYDAEKGTQSRKKIKFLIKDDSTEAKLICNTLEKGLSVTHATVLVNEFRKVLDLKPVSWSAIENWSLQSTVINFS